MKTFEAFLILWVDLRINLLSISKVYFSLDILITYMCIISICHISNHPITLYSTAESESVIKTFYNG